MTGRTGGRTGRPALAAALGLLVIMVSACMTPVCDLAPDRPSHHARNGGFCNPPGSPRPTASVPERVADNLRLALARHRGPVPDAFVPSPDRTLAGLREAAGADSVTWLGHATVLLRLGGQTVLTDPVWSAHVSPLPPFGPKRVSPPPLPLGALPPIDVLLVTHDHYDHLDLPTLRRLPGKERVEVIAPLGLGGTLRAAGFGRVRELDWWQSAAVGDLTVWMLPAVHESGRGLFRRNATLWGGYAVIGNGPDGARVVLSGDSGYGPHFAAIGARLGPFDLALMDVGGYAPLPVAQAYHFTPDEGARAVRELRAARAVPVHWGTYPLGAEPVFDSGPLFAEALRALDPGAPRILRIGETFAFRAGRAAAAVPARGGPGEGPGS